MTFRALEKSIRVLGKVLEKSWKFVSEKGYEPCYTESQNMPVNIREKSGNVENFVERSKHAGCYVFSIQETWNVLFRMSKEMHTV